MDGRAINEYGVVKIDATPVVYLTPVRLAGDGQDPGQWPGVEPFGRGEASPTPYKFPLWHSNGVSLFHRREGSRDENLVLLLDGPHTGLGRPAGAGLTGLGAHSGALVEVLVHPDVSPLVQAAQLGIHAGG